MPKYDNKLREEFDVTYRDGQYHVYIVRRGVHATKIYVGAFSNLDDVRVTCLEQFERDFNRDPKGVRNVWQRTQKGREALETVSLHEGSQLISVRGKTLEIGRPKQVQIAQKGLFTKAISPPPMSLLAKFKQRRQLATRVRGMKYMKVATRQQQQPKFKQVAQSLRSRGKLRG